MSLPIFYSNECFPIFWFDSNEYFGYINSYEELMTLYDIHKIWVDKSFIEFLKCCMQSQHDERNFGLRIEHNTTKSLYDFLIKNDPLFLNFIRFNKLKRL